MAYNSIVGTKICIGLGFYLNREILNSSPYLLAMVPKHIPLTWWQNKNIFTEFQVALYSKLKLKAETGIGREERAKEDQSKILPGATFPWLCGQNYCLHPIISQGHFAKWKDVYLLVPGSFRDLSHPATVQGIPQNDVCKCRRPGPLHPFLFWHLRCWYF